MHILKSRESVYAAWLNENQNEVYFDIQIFPAYQNSLPEESTLDNYDLFVITGSGSSAYDRMNAHFSSFIIYYYNYYYYLDPHLRTHIHSLIYFFNIIIIIKSLINIIQRMSGFSN